MQWVTELQTTIVQQPAADPLAIGQPPTLADFEMVREIQRGSHAAVWLVRKRQTNDEFAMKVIDKNRGRLHRLTTERKVGCTTSPSSVSLKFNSPILSYSTMTLPHCNLCRRFSSLVSQHLWSPSSSHSRMQTAFISSWNALRRMQSISYKGAVSLRSGR